MLSRRAQQVLSKYMKYDEYMASDDRRVFAHVYNNERTSYVALQAALAHHQGMDSLRVKHAMDRLIAAAFLIIRDNKVRTTPRGVGRFAATMSARPARA